MRVSLFASVCAPGLLVLSLASGSVTQTPDTKGLSGPLVHENLAVYFIHGNSVPGKVPLSLEEALASGAVKVRETGSVNQLEIENLAGDEVFVQSGDIVKGGKQDRTLMVSLLLPPHSGSIPIASFCVEEGRWTARGREDARQFSTASASVPSRELKLAMKAPVAAAPTPEALSADQSRRVTSGNSNPAVETGARQMRVWQSVRAMQNSLSDSVGAQVRSLQSASSLQLALESEKLLDAQKSYINALLPAGEGDHDIVGFVFAINGEINSADVYPSNGLFRKMWPKLLKASAIEAIGHRNAPAVAPPSREAVGTFLSAAEAGKSSERALAANVRLETREGEKAYLFETARLGSASAPGAWVHRNYLAK